MFWQKDFIFNIQIIEGFDVFSCLHFHMRLSDNNINISFTYTNITSNINYIFFTEFKNYVLILLKKQNKTKYWWCKNITPDIFLIRHCVISYFHIIIISYSAKMKRAMVESNGKYRPENSWGIILYCNNLTFLGVVETWNVADWRLRVKWKIGWISRSGGKHVPVDVRNSVAKIARIKRIYVVNR